MSAEGTNRANLVLNFIGVAIMGIGAWFATMVHRTGVETQTAVIEVKATQVAMKASQDETKETIKDTLKLIVPRNEHERIWRTYDADIISIRADLARLWLELQAVKLDVSKIQQKEKTHEK